MAVKPGDILTALTEKNSRRVCGMMSGTSADSIDVAICRIEGSGLPSETSDGAVVQLEYYEEHTVPSRISRRLRALPTLGVQDIAELNIEVAEAFADAFHATLAAARIEAASVDLIGSHGQTVYHHSRRPGARLATLQLGSGEVLSKKTGVPVVWDFRMKDVTSGGEGAPLTPYADLILYRGKGSSNRAVLNLGGIANVTVLPANPSEVMGFDTGPANAPLDRLARKLSNGTASFDLDGALAAKGRINEEVVAQLMACDAYLPLFPPKSSGFEAYGDNFVAKAAELHGGYDEHLMSTLLQFVVESIADAFRRFIFSRFTVDRVIVAGGGANNHELMRRLGALLAPVRVETSDAIGVPSAAREAMAFAILANDRSFGLPTSLPSVTGAAKGISLGAFSLP